MDLASRAVAISADQRRSADCLISPHCAVPDSARAFALAGASWLHLGPIGRRVTQMAVHPVDIASSRPPPPSFATRQNGSRRCLILYAPTLAEQRPYLGCSVDYLAVTSRPEPSARALVIARTDGHLTVYPIYGAAWRSRGGVSVTGPLVESIDEQLRWAFPALLATAAQLEELGRLTALLEGAARRSGRQPLVMSGEWRELALRAVQLRREHPGLTWLAIADRLRLDERTLRHYRQLLLFEQQSPPALMPIGLLASVTEETE